MKLIQATLSNHSPLKRFKTKNTESIFPAVENTY